MAAKEVVAAGFVVFRKIRNEISYLLMHAAYEDNLWTPPKGEMPDFLLPVRSMCVKDK